MALAPIRRFVLRLLNLVARRRAERELSREVSAHLALLEDDLVANGLTSTQARAAARQALDIVRTKERHREVRSFVIIEHAWRDWRYALRALAASPGFTAAAVITIALGIGASIAMFSVAYGAALRPLPYPDSDRLVRLYEANPSQGQFKLEVSEPAFFAWRRSMSSLEAVAMYSKPSIWFLNREDPPAVAIMGVSPQFFKVLRVGPWIGDGFTPEAYATRADDVILSYGGWQRLFGGRQDVIGTSVEFAGFGDVDAFTIVGVMPEDFSFAEPVDLWYAGFIREPTNRSQWSSRDDRVVARVRSDSTIERARAELEAVAARIAVERPASNGGWTVTVEGLHESIVGGFRRVSWFLLATVAVVLLVAILNVGSLMVARAATRERETAVRAALGAGRLRLMSMLLAEASVLTIAGSLAGLVLAWWMVRALKTAAPPGLPRLDAIVLDWQALLAAGVAMAVTIGTFAIIPLWRRGDGQLTLRLHAHSPGAGTAPAGFAVRTALTIVQCAGAAVLVVLALLLTRSLAQLTSVDLGWNPDTVVRLNVSPRMPRIFEFVAWAERLVAELEATPEVRRAAITTQIPFSADWYPSPVRRGGVEERWSAVVHSVTDNFFDTMGMQLLSGRLWQPDDRPTDAELTGRGRRIQGVAVVTAQTARTLWPDRPAIGETISAADFLDSMPTRVVVGVVDDIQFHAVGEVPALHVFIPWAQRPTGRPRLLVSTRDATDASIAAVRTVVERFVPETRIESIVPLRELVGRATAQPRFTSRIVAAFGGLALALAAVGIYGTLSYLVRARTREIGIRLALGAPQSAIVTSVLTRAMVPAIAGAAIGLVVAGGLAGSFRALLFNVDPLDRGAFAAGGLALLVVAVGAALGPALRATRVDPSQTLRAE